MIVILISLLVPALTQVKRYAKGVKQKAQFHSISVALDLYNAQFDSYPESDRLDSDSQAYCGAMKLAEAMMGQDLLGFHPESRFLDDDGTGIDELYPDNPPIAQPLPSWYVENLKLRKGPYLQLENANAYKIKSLYGTAPADVAPFDGEKYVLCDVYSRVRLVRDLSDEDDELSGKTGMPILYYRANTAKTGHDFAQVDASIYDYRDNIDLIDLGVPWSGFDHLIASTGTTSDGVASDPSIFYDKTQNKNIVGQRPYRADSYILLSAGFDGEYGTPDDIFNFER